MRLPALTTTEHDYQLCSDRDCPRFPCRVFREGREAGYHDGYDAGFADGYGAGYGAGFADGYSAGAAAASKE